GVSIGGGSTIIAASTSFRRGGCRPSVLPRSVPLSLPLRSSIVAPPSSSSDRPSRHSMLPPAGWRKIFSSVAHDRRALSCLRRGGGQKKPAPQVRRPPPDPPLSPPPGPPRFPRARAGTPPLPLPRPRPRPLPPPRRPDPP